MLTLYGIRTCDTCRKASAWLTSHGHPHRVHDLRTDGLDRSLLETWTGLVAWETLLNRKSATWRSLDDAVKNNLDYNQALTLMQAHPTLIKRPVLTTEDQLVVGFTPDLYSQIFP